MKKTPLRRLSKKREADYRAYLKEKDEFLEQKLFCEATLHCLNPVTQVHHMKGRAGALLRDKVYWLATCTTCHAWIHDNMKEARKRKLVLF